MITAIFVKYCYMNGSWLFGLIRYYVLFGQLITKGKRIMKHDYCYQAIYRYLNQCWSPMTPITIKEQQNVQMDGNSEKILMY